MHPLICFEGINYAGKTSVAKAVAKNIGARYGPRVAKRYKKEERVIHKNSDHLARFAFFMKEIVAKSEEVSRILRQRPVVMDRYLLSVLAYHNILSEKRLEEEIDASTLRLPDFTVLLTAGEAALRRRMAMRPPRHQYESNPLFLLRVQGEFLRLAERSASVIIDTSLRTAEETTAAVVEELGRRKIITLRSTSKEKK